MSATSPNWHIRLAQHEDIPALHALIEASIRGLQTNDYTPAQIEGALGTVLGLDTQLIRDQTYYVVEAADSDGQISLAGCGGWSKRKTLFGSDGASVREPELLDPATDAAKVRAIFVHPAFARQGLGSLILAHVEAAARAAGFHKYEMGSTITGVPLYTLKGYVPVEQIAVPLKNGESLPIVKMTKRLGDIMTPVKLLLFALMIFPLCGCMHSARLKPFAGQWVLKQSDENLMVLKTSVQHGRLSGTLISPKHFTELPSGVFTNITPPVEQKPVRAGKFRNGSLELLIGIKPDRDRLPMNLRDHDHAEIHWAKDIVPPWNFERQSSATQPVVTDHWKNASESDNQNPQPN